MDQTIGRTTAFSLQVMSTALLTPDRWIPFFDVVVPGGARPSLRYLRYVRLKIDALAQILGVTLEVVIYKGQLLVKSPITFLRTGQRNTETRDDRILKGSKFVGRKIVATETPGG